MTTRSTAGRIAALGAATAAALLAAVAVPQTASAETMRTFNLALSCSYGLRTG